MRERSGGRNECYTHQGNEADSILVESASSPSITLSVGQKNSWVTHTWRGLPCVRCNPQTSRKARYLRHPELPNRVILAGYSLDEVVIPANCGIQTVVAHK